jgi:hypothetical protein
MPNVIINWSNLIRIEWRNINREGLDGPQHTNVEFVLVQKRSVF